VAAAASDGTVRVWDGATGAERFRLAGRQGAAAALAWSADGGWLATAGGDGLVRVWAVGLLGQIPAGVVDAPLSVLTGLKGPVGRVAFSADGRRVAAAGRDGTGKVWDAVTGREVASLIGHRGPVHQLAFRPDGRQLVTAGDDRTVRVWDAATGEGLFILRGHVGPVRAVCYRSGGQRLASVDDTTLKVWDAVTGRQGLRLPGGLTGLAFSPDGKTLAAVSARAPGALTLWSVAEGRERKTLRDHKGRVTHCAFTADGRRLLAASFVEEPGPDRGVHVKVWDPAAGRDILTIREENTTFPPRVAFSADGARVAIVTEPVELSRSGNFVRLWDGTTGKRLDALEKTPLLSEVQCLAFSPDGRRLAMAGNPILRLGEQVIQVHDVGSGKVLMVGRGHTEAVHGLAFGPRGELLVTAGADQTVKVWDLRGLGAERRGRLGSVRQALRTLGGHTRAVHGLAFSPDGRRLATVSGTDNRTGGEVKVWDLPSGQEVLTLPYPGREVAFSPDGLLLAATGDDGVVRVWDGRPGRQVLTRREAGSVVAWNHAKGLLATAGKGESVLLWDAKAGRGIGVLQGHHTALVRRVVFSRDGQRLASAGEDGLVVIWEVGTWKALHKLKAHGDVVVGVAFSPDGRLLATASSDETAKVWDVETGQLLTTFTGHDERVLCVAFSPDGGRVVSGGDDKAVRVWDARTGRELLKLDKHQGFVNAVAFRPDGAQIVSAADDRTVRLWDAKTGKELQTWEGHKDGVRDAAFSLDGRRIASAGWDGQVKLWDVAAGRDVLTLGVQTEGYEGVAFGPDDRLATAGADLTLRVWDTKP
jgi:WD40 repeat protein